MAKVYEITTQDEPPSDLCAAKDCPVDKKDFAPGMFVVESGNKIYHAGCAKRNKISFKEIERKKVKRAKDD